MFGKNYGDFSGGTIGFYTKETAIAGMRKIIMEWESFDSILGRMPDKVTRENLVFRSFTDEITIADVFGNSKLSDWFQ